MPESQFILGENKISKILSRDSKKKKNYQKLSLQLSLKADVLVTWKSKITNMWIMFPLKYTRLLRSRAMYFKKHIYPFTLECLQAAQGVYWKHQQIGRIPSTVVFCKKNDFPFRQVCTEILPTVLGISSVPWSC